MIKIRLERGEFVRFLLIFLTIYSCQGPNLLTQKADSQHEDQGPHASISSQGVNTTRSGHRILGIGGNIIDAAVSMSFVISVERPQSTGLGGGGFLLYSQNGKTPKALDFREMAPLKSHETMYLDKEGQEIPNMSQQGIFSIATPGLVSGLLEIHSKFGHLPLKELLKDAIALADNGFIIYPSLDRALKAKKDVLYGDEEARKIFFNNKGEVLKEGDLLIQKDLANTLRIIAQKGKKGFYEGEIRDGILKTSKKYGGLLIKKDFSHYRPKWRKPIHGEYKDLEVYSMPLPSSGGIHIVQFLNILEKFPLEQWGRENENSIHVISEVMKMIYHDRAQYLGDSDFEKVNVKKLISKSYAKKLSELIKLDSTLDANKMSGDLIERYESSETTHFTLMDKDGNVVTSTQTINGWFGSGVVAYKTGIVLNNEMDDFATKPGAKNLFGAIGGKKNLIKPLKRPLSSMSPTIVFKNKRPVMGLGTPSGTRIITCVAQTILNYFTFKESLYNSVSSLRYHHQWYPDYIMVEEPGFKKSVQKNLEELGHHIELKDLGCKIQVVAKENDFLHGVSDSRGEGLSLSF